MVSSPGYESTTYTIFMRRTLSSFAVSGADHSCLVSQRRVVCWGLGTNGQLGRDDVISRGALPTDMTNLSFIAFTASLNSVGVADISLGTKSTCVLFTNAYVLCYGSNVYGESGAEVTAGGNIGDAPIRSVGNLFPILFMDPTKFYPVAQIAAGDRVTCALFTNVICYHHHICNC